VWQNVNHWLRGNSNILPHSSYYFNTGKWEHQLAASSSKQQRKMEELGSVGSVCSFVSVLCLFCSVPAKRRRRVVKHPLVITAS
jgi:hypothetical protein